MQGVQYGEDLSAERHEERPDQDARRLPFPARLHDLVETVELESLCDLEFLPHGRHLLVGKDDCLFFGDVKDEPLLFNLQIPAEYLKKLKQAECEPTFIFPHVDIGIEVDEYRKEEQ